MERVICIVGPTASGKTRLSVALAQALDAEIVSFDSMQLYRRMDIGTAKPTQEEQGGVPHHMIDVLDPAEEYSVGRYVQQADACVQRILAAGKPVILVGGTGLYVDSLVAGRQFAPCPQSGRREELTALAQQCGIEPLMEQLRRVDPLAAASIHPSNQKRVIRALEVYLETGIPFSEHNRRTQAQPPRYRPVWIGLDYIHREALYARITRRVDEMLERGLEAEVRALLDEGVPPTATSMQAIGYKELVRCLEGKESRQEAVEAIVLGTRHYAKRQRTWFRRNQAVNWLMLEDAPDFARVFLEARRLIPFFDNESCYNIGIPNIT